MGDNRLEHDSLGDIPVAGDRYWGAQTQRSLDHFAIGGEPYRWRRSIVRALGLVKQAAARSNLALGLLDDVLAQVIIEAAEEVIRGELDGHFPLGVFQTGSGTHSNMNANEVIANRAIEKLGGTLGSKTPVHPNDHVNLCQSSNDVFPTVMHVAVLESLQQQLLPPLRQLMEGCKQKSDAYQDLVKTGRTHLQDAAPLTLGQEISAWAAQLAYATQQLESRQEALRELALGGTAVGTGLNAHPEFGPRVAACLSEATGIGFVPAANKFAALAAHDPLVDFSAGLRTLAVALLKIANDVRWLASGPRCGIGELQLPRNEPGSSIMPGKVNPTQCEALSMVCVQVFGNDSTVAFAGSQGNFQLNAYKPVIVHNVLESILLLGNACHSFHRFCISGLVPNKENISDKLQRNLMLATALNKHIGYDKAASVVKLAESKNLTVKQACLELGAATDEQLELWVNALDMTRHS